MISIRGLRAPVEPAPPLPKARRPFSADARPPSPWTPDRDDDLRRLWAEGLSGEAIAGELGAAISKNAVIGRVHRLGLPKRRSPIVLPGARHG